MIYVINVRSTKLVKSYFEPATYERFEGWRKILRPHVVEWLEASTPTATHMGFYAYTELSFRTEADLLMFKLAFSDEL